MPAPSVLDALAKATDGHAERAGDADRVAGVPASWVASPGSTDETAEVLRVAAEHQLRVVPRGNGSKLGWGVAPEAVDLILDTGRLDRVVEHAAGDLVAVVEAGLGLAELADRLAGAGQRLAADQTLPGATVGGTLAAAASGPSRLLYGAVRDLVIGATLVRADGVVAHAGGKVVKNVAGYDLGKLFCGSYGTLGVLTRAAFRLHPVPAARTFVSLATADPADTHSAVQRVLRGQVAPTAVELDRPAGGPGPATVSVLLEGTGTGVAGRTRETLRLLGPDAAARPDPPDGWGRYPAGPGDVLVKLTAATGGLRLLLEAVAAGSAEAGLPVAVRGSAGVGVLYAGIPGAPAGADPGAVRQFVGRLRRAAPSWSGAVVVLDAPAPVRAAVDMWGPVSGLDLMRRVKQEFDPGRRLSPGRFVGGI
jgi:glycolate oxidase FAD binding subunit